MTTKETNTKILMDLGENLETATTIASNKLASINISGMEHLVLVSENNNFIGKNLDYMVIGEYINETSNIIYIIDGIKVNSFLTLNNETINTNVDGCIDGLYQNQIDFKFIDADIQLIQEEYEVAYNAYLKLDIPTLLKILHEIRNLTEVNENTNKTGLEEFFEEYKKNIVTLKKSAK